MTSVATPDGPAPSITTPPAELVETVKEALPFLGTLSALDDNAGQAQAREATQGSADFLRNLFPHLDDLTLAAFCTYVAVNLSGSLKDSDLCPDVVKVAIVFADIAQALAWSLATPEAPEVTS